MRTIDTGGICFIVPFSGTSEWYFGISREQGDLYEAEEIFKSGGQVSGNSLCLVHYPSGEVFRPAEKKPGTYFETPVYLDGCISFLDVDLEQGVIRISSFDCISHETSVLQELPLSKVTNCYNLQLHTAPLTLTRQGDEGLFEVIWPERSSFQMDPHESFFLREGEKLYFNKWYEEGEGREYRYWEETVVRGIDGQLIETLPGDVMKMPGGELWNLA